MKLGVHISGLYQPFPWDSGPGAWLIAQLIFAKTKDLLPAMLKA